MDDLNINNNENNGVNTGNSPEPSTDGQNISEGVNLFKAPETDSSANQGSSDAQQNVNFNSQPAPAPVQPNPAPFNAQNNMGGYNQNENVSGGGKGLSIGALVCGIVSILGFCCCTPIGIICGIAGIVLGIISKKKNCDGAGMALAGIITGAVGIVGSVVWLIVGTAMGSSDFLEELQEALESASVFFM